MTDKTLDYDPDVKIPAAVKAAAQKAEEMHRQMSGNAEPEESDEEGNTEVTAEGNDGQPPMDAPEAETEKEPARASEPEAKTEPDEAKADPDDQTWEHKYNSVNGRYKTAMEELRKMGDQVTQMQNLIATMQTGPTKTDAPAAEELSADLQLTSEELNDYGEDFLKVVGKKARAELAPIINGYKAQIEQLTAQLNGVKGVMQNNSTEKMLTQLDSKVPSWRDMNTNEQFLNWLGLPDPYSGAIRHDMLKAAYAQGNADRVAAFFNGFLAEEAVVAPAKAAEPDPEAKKVDKVPLKDLAAPGRAKTAASAQAPAEKPLISRAQIAAFYSDVSAGKYRGKDQEKAAAEATIFQAQREGRITS
jgi:hypothetical protein